MTAAQHVCSLGVASCGHEGKKTLTWVGRGHPQGTLRSCWRQFWPHRWRWWRADVCRGPGSEGLLASWKIQSGGNFSGLQKTKPEPRNQFKSNYKMCLFELLYVIVRLWKKILSWYPVSVLMRCTVIIISLQLKCCSSVTACCTLNQFF